MIILVWTCWVLCIAGEDPIHPRIDFDFQDAPLESAMQDVVTDHQLPVIYQVDQLVGKTVTARCSACTAEQALDVLLQDTPLVWKRLGTQYVVVQPSGRLGEIRGYVRMKESGQPLSGIPVWLISRKANKRRNAWLETATTAQGRFRFKNLKAGTYDLSIKTPGFEAIECDGIQVTRDLIQELEIEVEEVVLPLQEMVVTPSTYALLQWEPSTFQVKSRQQINRTPHLGDDVYRTISTIPGANTDDLSAKFTVRGAPHEQILVLLDGMELYSPFHAQDMSGVFSVVDSEAIGALTLMTGGFSSEYGGKMGGVLDMESAVPNGPRTEAGLNFSHVRFLSEGVFSDGLGHYVLSARVGNLAPLLIMTEASQNELDVLDVPIPGPSYYDTMGKLSTQFSERFGLSLHYLIAQDTFHNDEDSGDFQFDDADVGELRTRYGQDYYWMRFRSDWSTHVSAHTAVYYSDSTTNRRGFKTAEDFQMDLNDVRRFTSMGVKQDWSFSLGSHHFVKLGWEMRRLEAEYNYTGSVWDPDPLFGHRTESIRHVIDLDGEEWRAYLSDRIRFTDRLVLELGLRYDEQDYIEEAELSPRVHWVIQLAPHTKLFASWGVYHQHQGLQELQVEDDVASFFPTERSDHYLLAAETRLFWGIMARAEAYYKDLRRQRPRFENIYQNAAFFPEFEEDRMAIDAPSGEAYGLECLLRQNLGKHLSWFFNYAYGVAEDHFDDRHVPKRQDQTHTINTEVNLRISTTWNANLIWKYHSGWPTTDLILDTTDPQNPVVSLGPLYAERYPDYRRLDLRISRRKHLSAGHGLTFFVDLNNIGDHPNPRGIEHVDLLQREDGRYVLEEDIDQGMGFLPSIGLTWVF